MMTPYYEDDGVVLYHGDCREILPSLRADLLLTDPPYGIGEAAGKNKSRGSLRIPPTSFPEMTWDNNPPSAWLFGLMQEVSKYQIIFGGNYFPLPPSRCWLVWNKMNGSNDFADCELAWTNLNKAVRKIDWRWNGMLQQDMKHKEVRVHPTQKPEPVMRWCIEQAPDECELILDPFAGSGTTLLAARNLGRKAIGVEREESYCEIAAKRLDTPSHVHQFPVDSQPQPCSA